MDLSKIGKALLTMVCHRYCNSTLINLSTGLKVKAFIDLQKFPGVSSTPITHVNEVRYLSAKTL